MVLKSKRTNKNFYKKGKRTLKGGGGWFKKKLPHLHALKFLKKKSKVSSTQISPPLPQTHPTHHIYDTLYANRQHENPYNRLEGFIHRNNQNKPYNTFVRSKPNPSNTELGHLGQASITHEKIHMSNPASRKLPAIPESIPESIYDTVKFLTKKRHANAINSRKTPSLPPPRLPSLNALKQLIAKKTNVVTLNTKTDLPPKTYTDTPLENYPYPARQEQSINANIQTYKETEATMAQLRAKSRLPESRIYENVPSGRGRFRAPVNVQSNPPNNLIYTNPILTQNPSHYLPYNPTTTPTPTPTPNISSQLTNPSPFYENVPYNKSALNLPSQQSPYTSHPSKLTSNNLYTTYTPSILPNNLIYTNQLLTQNPLLTQKPPQLYVPYNPTPNISALNLPSPPPPQRPPRSLLKSLIPNNVHREKMTHVMANIIATNKHRSSKPNNDKNTNGKLDLEANSTSTNNNTTQTLQQSAQPQIAQPPIVPARPKKHQ